MLNFFSTKKLYQCLIALIGGRFSCGLIFDRLQIVKARHMRTGEVFLEVAGEVLLADEIRHRLAYGVAERVTLNAHAFGSENPWFIILEDSGKICATAIRTPPRHPIIS